jgi:hypothetical protein
MKKPLLAITFLVLSAVGLTAAAGEVTCPLHNYASCYDTGKIAPTGSGAHLYHCTCGDEVWVAQ